MAIHPESPTLRQQLPLFVGAASGTSALWSFVLTDESGMRQFVFVAAEGTLSVCMVSSSRQPTPLLALLASIIKRAAGDGTPQDGSQGRDWHLLRALPILCGALLPPPPGAELELRLWDGRRCRFGAPAAPMPAADGLLLDVLSVLGLEQTLRVWCALLLERPVLLISDCVPLLSAAAEGLVALLAPLRWEGTYVPVLPSRLIEYVEAPTPFLMGASRRLVDATPSLDLSTVLVADLDRGALRLPSTSPPPPALPCDGLGCLEPLATMLVRRASAAARLRAAPAVTAAPSATRVFGVAQRCFLRLLRALLHPNALRAAVQPQPQPQPQPQAAAGDGMAADNGATAVLGRPSSDDPIDWEAYVASLSAEARAYCEELRGTLMFEGLVNDMMSGATPLEELEDGNGDGNGDNGDGNDGAIGTDTGASVGWINTPVLEVSFGANYEVQLTSDGAPGDEVEEEEAAEAAPHALLAGLSEDGWRVAASTLRETLDAANAPGDSSSTSATVFARRVAGLLETTIEGTPLPIDCLRREAVNAAELDGEGESLRKGSPPPPPPPPPPEEKEEEEKEEEEVGGARRGMRRHGALHALHAGYLGTAKGAQRALLECEVAWRFDAAAVPESAVAPLVGAMTRAELQATLAILSGEALPDWSDSHDVDAAATRPGLLHLAWGVPGPTPPAPSNGQPSIVTTLVRDQLARLTQREAEKARAAAAAAAAAAERARREAEAEAEAAKQQTPSSTADAATTTTTQISSPPDRPEPPPSPPPEGQPYNGQTPSEAPPPGGAVAISARLLSDAVALFRAHADAGGRVGRRELLGIRASGGFAQLVRRTGWLRGVRVGPASLGEGARLAFWLNVYNLLLMHGYALHATELNRRQSAAARGLRVVRLHSRFVYAVGCDVGGDQRSLWDAKGAPAPFAPLFSAVEVEHALLRREQRTSPFPFSSWLLPKFGAADPRAALAPPPCRLLAFGLVAGTPFSPPLRIYGGGGAASGGGGFDEPPTLESVIGELEDNARQHLAGQGQVVLSSAEAAAAGPRGGGQAPPQLQLPAVLQWHMADLGADTPAQLGALLPLLPRALANELSPLLTAPAELAWSPKPSYGRAVWEVWYDVGTPSSPR